MHFASKFWKRVSSIDQMHALARIGRVVGCIGQQDASAPALRRKSDKGCVAASAAILPDDLIIVKGRDKPALPDQWRALAGRPALGKGHLHGSRERGAPVAPAHVQEREEI